MAFAHSNGRGAIQLARENAALLPAGFTGNAGGDRCAVRRDACQDGGFENGNVAFRSIARAFGEDADLGGLGAEKDAAVAGDIEDIGVARKALNRPLVAFQIDGV